MTSSKILYKNSFSLLLASSAENSTSGQSLRAYFTASTACSKTCSGESCNLYCIWIGEVAIKVWIRGLLEYLTASQARSISVSYTHLRAHETVLDLVCRLLLEK